jgi:predicted dehydrogenase
VKIGIVGLGFMGATHLSAYAQIPGAQISAVCSNSPKALSGDLSDVGGNLGRSSGKFDFSAVRKYTRWEDIVRDPDLDIIDICAPTDLHSMTSILALESGKHVCCEKPMALSLAECRQMIDAADAHNRILMVAQVLRFWPEYLALESFVRSDTYGRILSATFVRQCGLPDWSRWLPREERSGGAVIDLLIHDIDQALKLFGMPQRVVAKKLGDVDALTASLLYPNGPEVRIQGGWFQPSAAFSMSFKVRAERAELNFTADGLMLDDQNGRRTKMDVSSTDGYTEEAAYFLDCCRTNKKPERCLPRDSAQALQLALLLKQSRAAGGEQIQC